MTTETFWVPLARDVVTVSGADARAYLHSQLSQDVSGMRVGETRQSLVLQPSGKLDGIIRITCIDGETFVLDVDEGCGDAVLARLNRFKIRVKVDLSLGRENWVAVRNVTTPIPGSIPAWRCDGSAFDLRREHAFADYKQGSLEDYEQARIIAAWPKMNIDVTAASIPAETGIIDIAVNFTKGCYPGQELVERMDSRGSIAPRQLRYIQVGEGAEVGREIEFEGRQGVITSLSGTHALVALQR
ncbi:MAG: YgfZ/GcvT domain-containing protein [Actinomycetes bacterium]